MTGPRVKVTTKSFHKLYEVQSDNVKITRFVQNLFFIVLTKQICKTLNLNYGLQSFLQVDLRAVYFVWAIPVSYVKSLKTVTYIS